MLVEIGNNETIKAVTRFMWECLRRRDDYKSEFNELSKRFTQEIRTIQDLKLDGKLEMSSTAHQQIAWFCSRWRISYPKDPDRKFDEAKDFSLFTDSAVGLAKPLWESRYQTVLNTLALVEQLMGGKITLTHTRAGKARYVRSYKEALEVVRNKERELAAAMKNRESKHGRTLKLMVNVDAYPFDEILSVTYEALNCVIRDKPKGRVHIPELFELDIYEMWSQGNHTLSEIVLAFHEQGISSVQRVDAIVKRIERWMEKVAPWDFTFTQSG